MVMPQDNDLWFSRIQTMKKLTWMLLCAALLAMTGCEPYPRNPENWSYRKTIETSGATSYIFESNAMPPLTLTSNASTANIEDVNVVLRFLGIPTIDRNVPDKGYATHSRPSRGTYEWDDYPLGKLIVWRTIAKDKLTNKGYDAIWKVTVCNNK